MTWYCLIYAAKFASGPFGLTLGVYIGSTPSPQKKQNKTKQNKTNNNNNNNNNSKDNQTTIHRLNT